MRQTKIAQRDEVQGEQRSSQARGNTIVRSSSVPRGIVVVESKKQDAEGIWCVLAARAILAPLMWLATARSSILCRSSTTQVRSHPDPL